MTVFFEDPGDDQEHDLGVKLLYALGGHLHDGLIHVVEVDVVVVDCPYPLTGGAV